ncbi:MAG: DUF4058 family protein [Caldilineaceae bacterium]
MPTPFLGMDPYLERRGLWEEIHTNLIVAIQHFLTPLLRPKYRVAVEQRTYLSLVPSEAKLIGKPDVMVVAPSPAVVPASTASLAVAEATVADLPLPGELPMAEEIIERHLEIRDTATQEVITAIEILSPTNKQDAEGRQQYERKRLNVLASATSLVEIDLLRGGQPFAMKVKGATQAERSDYRIVISRSWRRPAADRYLFSVRQPLPAFHIPLRPGEEEPVLPLNQILHELYDRGGYDLAIDYSTPPSLPLSAANAQCAAELLQGAL